MSNKPRKWPEYALESLENTLANQKSIQQLTREAQEAIRKGHYVEAVILLGDVREAASRSVDHLVSARTGNYHNATI